MKRYLVIIILILIIVLGILGNNNVNLRNDRNRHRQNYTELKDYSDTHIKQLELTKKEFEQQMGDSIQTLLDSLQIKPKHIIEYVHIYHKDIDTVDVKVPMYIVDTDTYKWQDITGCFNIKGTVELCDTIPQVYINEKSYINSSQYVMYEGKRSKKFLFFRYGPRERRLKVIPQCGDEFYQKFDIIDNK